MLDGGYLSNGLHCAYTTDNLPLDHWFHAFQTVFLDMVVQGPPEVLAALQERSTGETRTYDYRGALDLYSQCRIRPLPGVPDPDGDFCATPD